MRTWWHRLQRVRASDDGVSLAEVLVAMFIFALVSTGLAYSLLSVLNLTREARARTVAANVAAQQIDLAREASAPGRLFQLLDEEKEVTVGSDTYRVVQRTQWVSDAGSDAACGTNSGSGVLRYKRVNVTVTWPGMREGAQPVRSDTVVSPSDHINEPEKGSILVRVLRADGTGNPGVTVSAPGTGVAVAPTDAQGCTYILNVDPDEYTITVSKPGHVSDAQQGSPSVDVTVMAGSSVSVPFQLDQAATYRALLAHGAPADVKRPTTGLLTSFVSTYNTVTPTATANPGSLTPSFSLHPFTSGYQAFAGHCAAADPRAWPEQEVDGVTYRGVLSASVATTPGGTADVPVPMGLVTISGGAGGQFLRAVSEPPPVVEPALPGCASTVDYRFGNVLVASGSVTIALPYGTWRLYSGPTAGTQTTAIDATRITVQAPAAPVVPHLSGPPGAAVVTLDPRTPGVAP